MFEPEPPIKVEVVTPKMPDISEALAAVLSDDDTDEKSDEATVVPPPRKPAPRNQTPELSDTTPGMVAPNVRPGRPRIPVRQLTGLRARSKDEPPPIPAGTRKAQSSTLAIGVIIALVVATVVIAIIMLSSFFGMISDITD
jgi:hypothetical protein